MNGAVIEEISEKRLYLQLDDAITLTCSLEDQEQLEIDPDVTPFMTVIYRN